MGSISAVTPRSATATKDLGKERSSPPANIGLTTCPFSPKLLYDKQAAAVNALIHGMPDWVDKEQVKKQVSTKKEETQSWPTKILEDQTKQKMITAR